MNNMFTHLTENYEACVAVILFAIGMCMLLFDKNLLKKVIGLDIVELKGYTSSGVALSACRLIGSIVRNEKSVVPVSTVLSGQYGMTGVAMSLPCVISKNGIDRVLELPLDENGKKDLENCYEHLRTAITSVYPEEKNL